MLPASVNNAVKVQLSGGFVMVRGLNVAEMEVVAKLDGRAGNILSIAYATGEDHEAVKAWYDSPSTSASDAKALIDTIADLSGIGQGAQFPGGTGDDARPARAE